jgi:rubrerythrin
VTAANSKIRRINEMANVFAGSEIIELGIQIEKNGKDFYDVLESKTKSKKAKEVFRYLAGEEERHIAVFKNILESVRQYEPAEAYPGEYFSYMSALAAGYVFTKKNKGAEAARKTKSDREALELGISFEKESILFYEGMKGVVPEDEHGVLNSLILQERSHLRQLVELKAKS